MSYILPDDNKASEMMWAAGPAGGGPMVYCSCGVDHYKNDEEEENEENFEYIEIDGLAFVYGCAGCETKLAKYERFIWNNRNHIRQYLKIRIDQELKWAEQEKLLNTLADIK